MAAVSVSPLPPSISSMSNRRAPLSINSNAINSTLRTVSTTTIATKPKRSHATIQREETYGQPPPAKRQMLEAHQVLKPSTRCELIQPISYNVLPRKDNSLQQISLERKGLKAREKPLNINKSECGLKDDHESIRQWQKHYRKIFPSFVFYFDNVGSEVQVKCMKAVMSLGAREEKFFSNTVTHVITTRNIPPELQPTSTKSSLICPAAQSQKCSPHTINLSLIDRSFESINVLEPPLKPKIIVEAPAGKRIVSSTNNVQESRKNLARSSDVLNKARELGMKIWSLEKLERIINVIFDADAGSQFGYGNNSRTNSNQPSISRIGREPDLQQLLKNEKINGPSDRDLTVASKEIYLFKGPYIYIYDIDEKQKPIMVREYPKVHNKEDGDWPQFRSVSNGKCPFIDEVDYGKREAEKEMEQLRIRKQLDKEKALGTGKVASPSTMQQKPKPMIGKRVLERLYDDVNATNLDIAKQKNVLSPLKRSISSQLDTKALSKGNAFVSRGGVGCLYEGEPVASGVQPTITSAIRSTMSSTAAQPGLKAGTSKEVHDMQRKVLEKKIVGAGSHDVQSSHRPNEINGLNREEVLIRNSKDKLAEKAHAMEVNLENNPAPGNSHDTENSRKSKAVQHQNTIHQEPKPGYCENCQDKFNDFNDHVLSRKHRKFAEKSENWKSLDELLVQLKRPVRAISDDKHL